MRVFLFLALLLSPLSKAFPQTLTPELLWQMGRVTLFDVSPDDSLALYGVTRYDLEKNSGQTDLFLIRINGADKGEAFQLTRTPASETGARFRPDGKRIGYLRGGEFWEVNPDGSGEKQLTRGESWIGFQYSPNGQQILFAKEVAYPSPADSNRQDLPFANARVYDQLGYRHWNAWMDESFSNLFLVDYSDGILVGEPRNLTPEALDFPYEADSGLTHVSWSSDGSKIAFAAKKVKGTEGVKSTNTDIFVLHLNTGYVQTISEKMPGYDREPVFSPNGRFLAWSSMAAAGYESDRERIFLYDFQTQAKWDMTANLDQTSHSPRWARDNNRVFFISPYNGTNHIFQVDFSKKGQFRPLTNGHFDYTQAIPTTSSMVVTRESLSAPPEIFRLSTDTGRASQLTFTNQTILESLELGEVKKRYIRTTDGKRMLTWVVLPPGFDSTRQYPSILYCQGGPQNAVSQYWSYRWNLQTFAARGYVVIAPNRRGTPGFGQAWTDQIAGDWGGRAMQDLLLAADDLKRESWIADDQMSAIGPSFGGFSVYWLAGHHEKRFRSFVAHAGVFNLESWYGATDEIFFADHDMGGPYWNDPSPKTFGSDSPHLFVDQWDTPILIIQGGRDFRVPESEGFQAFQAAQLRGIPSRFLYFPDEAHGILQPQNSVFWYRMVLDWLEEEE